jgi:signal peptidase complex subunit 3
MHTVWVRLNAVVFFGLTVLLCLSGLAALSKLGHTLRHRPVVEKLALNSLRNLKRHGGVDRALFSFDLKVDLTPAFHWNVKQLFVYVVAYYETEGKTNQVVLWDKIVEADDPKILNEEGIFVKYALVDPNSDLRGRDVKLQLFWDHMPLTGLLYIDKQPFEETSTFTLPIEYN